MGRTSRRLLLVVGGIGAAVVAAVSAIVVVRASSTPPPPAEDRQVDVGGGLSMHIHCQGTGSPVVVLESGAGGNASVWSHVQPDIARFARVCSYDRLGLGRSTRPAPRPHSIDQMVGELHNLLAGAGVPPPYVLVGHSLGGVNIRLFGSAHPDEVLGMVLIDVVSEEQPSRYWALLPEPYASEWRRSDTPPEGLDYETMLAGLAELRASSRSLGDKPLIVLTHGVENPVAGASPEQMAKLRSAWLDMQADLTHLSTNSAQVVAVNSGHFIQGDAPRLVIAAVRQAVDAVRTHGRVDGNALAPLADEGFSL